MKKLVPINVSEEMVKTIELLGGLNDDERNYFEKSLNCFTEVAEVLRTLQLPQEEKNIAIANVANLIIKNQMYIGEATA